MTADTRQMASGLVVIGFLMSGAIAVERARDHAYPLRTIEDQSLYITSGVALGRLSLGFKALTADLYWMRTLQYFGDIQRAHRVKGVPDVETARREYDWLYPLLDLTTTLDPYFNLAYRFGSTFLSERPPAGPGRPDLAITLLQKGLQARPDRWEYMHDIGYVHYWWDHDYIAAAEAFRKASQMPGAPWWLTSLAATTLVEGGDRQTSRRIFQTLLQSAEIDWLRTDAQRRLAQLDALDGMDLIQTALTRYAARTGQTPTDWASVVRAGDLRGIPLDPAGIPFVVKDGRVELSYQSPLWPLPEEPAKTKRPPS